MAIALTLLEYLEYKGVDYEVVPHPHSASSSESAEAAHVPGDQLAKGVILAEDGKYLMAVVPATYTVELDSLGKQLNRSVGLATEEEIAPLFKDCEVGAVPPVGQAYGVDVILDERLTQCADVYFEAGNHTDLVRVSGDDFNVLMAGVEHGHFSQHR